MNNLFDMMMDAQQGMAKQTLAKQFGLSEDQVEKAIEGLMPAFSHGLKRNTADPFGTMNFLQALSGGQHQKFFDDPTQAFREDAIDEGNKILGHLFGNKDVSRAVADQVALSSGVGSTILKQMLPVVAQMVLGGLFKGSTGGRRRSSNPMEELMGSFMESMMKGGLESMMGGGRSQSRTERSYQPEPEQSTNPMANNPLGKMMEDFLGGAFGGAASQSAREEYEQREEPKTGADIFGEMFETGRQVNDTYRKGVESIFDQYLDGMKRR